MGQRVKSLCLICFSCSECTMWWIMYSLQNRSSYIFSVSRSELLDKCVLVFTCSIEPFTALRTLLSLTLKTLLNMWHGFKWLRLLLTPTYPCINVFKSTVVSPHIKLWVTSFYMLPSRRKWLFSHIDSALWLNHWLHIFCASLSVPDSNMAQRFCMINLFETAPLCLCSILSNSSEARTIPLSVWLSWEETQLDIMWIKCLSLTPLLCLQLFLETFLNAVYQMSPVTFSTVDEKIKSLLEELSVGASPGATLQMSSLWAGIFWKVPQTHSRQRARSYNTWSRGVERIITLIHDGASCWHTNATRQIRNVFFSLKEQNMLHSVKEIAVYE